MRKSLLLKVFGALVLLLVFERALLFALTLSVRNDVARLEAYIEDSHKPFDRDSKRPTRRKNCAYQSVAVFYEVEICSQKTIRRDSICGGPLYFIQFTRPAAYTSFIPRRYSDRWFWDAVNWALINDDGKICDIDPETGYSG